MSHHPADYEFCGLRIRSCVALPNPVSAAWSQPDIEIRFAQLRAPQVLSDTAVAGFGVEGDALYLAIRDVATFRARAGREILIDAQPNASAADLALYLTGSVFGAILHQRGIFPLHASAVEVGGGAMAFAGGSGQGKSTIAGFLTRRGYHLVADDVCVLDTSPVGSASVWPGAARLKLGREGLDALAQQVEGLAPAGGTRDKYQLPVRDGLNLALPLPLKTVYILAEGEGETRTERLTGLNALDALAGQTYCAEFVPSMGLERSWFGSVARVARAVEIKRLIRPRGLQHMDVVLDLLESEWRAS